MKHISFCVLLTLLISCRNQESEKKNEEFGSEEQKELINSVRKAGIIVLSPDDFLAFRDTLAELNNPVFDEINTLIDLSGKLAKQQLGAEENRLTIETVTEQYHRTKAKIISSGNTIQPIREIDPDIGLKKSVLTFQENVSTILDTDFKDFIEFLQKGISKNNKEEILSSLTQLMSNMDDAEKKLHVTISDFDNKHNISE